MSCLLRACALFAIAIFATSSVHAEGLSVTAKRLPGFNVLCYRVMITNFSENAPEQVVQGKADDFPRYNLYTVDGLVLKVVNNPQEPGLRQEHGKFAPEVFISPVTDPKKRPPVYSWREATNGSTSAFSYRADEKILSVVTMYKANRFMQSVNSNEVLTCREK